MIRGTRLSMAGPLSPRARTITKIRRASDTTRATAAYRPSCPPPSPKYKAQGQQQGRGPDVHDAGHSQGGQGRAVGYVVPHRQERELDGFAGYTDGQQAVYAQADVLDEEQPDNRDALAHEEQLPAVGATQVAEHEHSQGKEHPSGGQLFRGVKDFVPLQASSGPPSQGPHSQVCPGPGLRWWTCSSG